MIEGIQPNINRIKVNLEQSLMLVTSLTPTIGYEKASRIALHAHKKGITLREASIELNYISKTDFDLIINPKLMINLEKE